MDFATCLAMASLRARLDGLLADVGLTPGRTLLDDVQALASALGVDGNACVAEVVGASELALYGANGKSTSDAARTSRASLLKKRKMSERDAEVSDEMQVATLVQFVDGVVDAAGLGVKLRQFTLFQGKQEPSNLPVEPHEAVAEVSKRLYNSKEHVPIESLVTTLIH